MLLNSVERLQLKGATWSFGLGIAEACEFVGALGSIGRLDVAEVSELRCETWGWLAEAQEQNAAELDALAHAPCQCRARFDDRWEEEFCSCWKRDQREREQKVIDAERDAEQADEIYAENAWLRAAEYDPRMNDPREW